MPAPRARATLLDGRRDGMTDLAPLLAALSLSVEGVHSLLWQLLVAALLLSPNLVALARHGTTDLLAAHGYTMEEWIEERRAS